MSQGDYNTVRREAQIVTIEKKSRFIATVRPVSTEEDALALIAEMRSQYADATHNVYAYCIRDNQLQRYSDDGEPAGTAGIPVLEAIKSQGLIDVAVVVTRYFGGTLLGTGGLVRAYGGAAREGLTQAGPITMARCAAFTVECAYTTLGRLQYEIAQRGYLLEDTQYTDGVTMTVCVRQAEAERFVSIITEAAAGQARIHAMGCKYIAIDLS